MRNPGELIRKAEEQRTLERKEEEQRMLEREEEEQREQARKLEEERNNEKQEQKDHLKKVKAGEVECSECGTVEAGGERVKMIAKNNQEEGQDKRGPLGRSLRGKSRNKIKILKDNLLKPETKEPVTEPVTESVARYSAIPAYRNPGRNRNGVLTIATSYFDRPRVTGGVPDTSLPVKEPSSVTEPGIHDNSELEPGIHFNPEHSWLYEMTEPGLSGSSQDVFPVTEQGRGGPSSMVAPGPGPLSRRPGGQTRLQEVSKESLAKLARRRNRPHRFTWGLLDGTVSLTQIFPHLLGTS